MGRRVLWIFAAAAAIRVAFALLAPGVALSDGRFYHMHAAVLQGTGAYLNGDGSPAIRWMPGWPALLALLYSVFGVIPRVGMLACALLDAATAAATAGLGARLFGRTAGTLAGLLYALWPGAIYYAGTLFTEPLFNLLFVMTLLLVAYGREDSARPGLEIAAGLCFGLAAYVKSEPLALAPALLFAIWRLDPRPRPFARRALALLGVAVALLAPWTLRNYLTFDRFIPTSASGGVVVQLANQAGASGGQDFKLQAKLQRRYRGANQAETTIRRNDVGWGEALRFARENPAELRSIIARKLRLTYFGDVQAARTLRGTGPPEEWHVSPDTFRSLVRVANAWWWSALFLAALGATTWRRWPRGAGALLFAPLVTLAALHIVFLGGQRFHVPEIPIYALLAAQGLLLLGRAARRLR
jgi:4-amino-4-deoxy-L-arabinose transferase-like glycosyltransferase